MITTIVLAIVIFALTFVSLVTKRRIKNYPPGPVAWPLIGNRSLLRRLSRNLGGQHLAFLELNKRYDSDVIGLRIGNKDVVVVSGNKLIHTVLNSQDYDGRPWNEFIRLRNMGKKNGITMNEGPEWKDIRGWLVRSFRTVGFGQQAMSELIKDELARILENLKEGEVCRMKPVIAPAVINVLWTLTTGKRFSDVSRLQYFTDLLERRSRVFDMAGGLLSTFPWIRYIAPERSGYNLLVTLNNELKCFLEETIKQHKDKYLAGSETDLIDMFLREINLTKDGNTVYTEEQLVMILVDLFLAGCSTTSSTLDFLFLNVALHQDVQDQIQREIDSVIPKDRLPDLQDRPKLPYTEAVLSESQRMWVVTPIIGPRRVVQDTVLENYRIPKDTDVLINIYSANMDANLYPEPYKFKPERFIKNGIYEPIENLITFGKGRRRCPGEVLAKSALFLIFAGVLQKYKILPVPDKRQTEVKYVAGLTLAPEYYEVLIVPR